MSVTVYKALKHRILAGKKIYLNNDWKTIPANAKMWLNGAWHKIGFSGSQNSAVIPTPPEIPDVPAQSLTHENGTEPSTGTIWYITPNGVGNMDGSSWENAAPISMIHVILLSCSSGDSVYLSEGDYTIDRTIVLPASVNLYGGFDAASPVWSTRNGFTKQTVFTGNGTFGWMDGSAAIAGQIVDGFVIKNYNSTITSKGTLRNSIVIGGTADIPIAYNCVFDSANVSASKITYCNIFSGDLTISGSTADHVNVYGTSEAVKTATLTNATVSNSLFYYCSLTAKSASYCDVFYGSRCSISDTANHVNVYGTKSKKVSTSISTAQYCTALNCSAYNYIFRTATNCTAINCTNHIFGDNATNCTAINCSAGYGAIFSYNATNCTALNCTSQECIFGLTNNYIVTNCTAINCICNSIASTTNGASSFIFNCDASNCTAVNCTCNSINNNNYSGTSAISYIFSYNATNCTAVNCACDSRRKTTTSLSSTGAYSIIFYRNSVNCTAVNCTATSDNNSLYNSSDAYSRSFIFYEDSTNCTAVNCAITATASGSNLRVSNAIFNAEQYLLKKNCISWNNSGTEFNDYSYITTCAGSTYNAALKLVLGTNNSIARFTNTGYYPAQGVQDVGDCPSPIDDPTGYATYIASFGDWHPAANSFLIGKGTADSSVTTDLDNVNRPNPPTIGAYEPRPAST